MQKLLNIKDQLRDAPELVNVEIINIETDRIELIFKPETQRTGKELLKVQDILFKNNIFNFIKSEKVLLWDNIIRQISISIY